MVRMYMRWTTARINSPFRLAGSAIHTLHVPLIHAVATRPVPVLLLETGILEDTTELFYQSLFLYDIASSLALPDNGLLTPRPACGTLPMNNAQSRMVNYVRGAQIWPFKIRNSCLADGSLKNRGADMNSGLVAAR